MLTASNCGYRSPTLAVSGTATPGNGVASLVTDTTLDRPVRTPSGKSRIGTGRSAMLSPVEPDAYAGLVAQLALQLRCAARLDAGHQHLVHYARIDLRHDAHLRCALCSSTRSPHGRQGGGRPRGGAPPA